MFVFLFPNAVRVCVCVLSIHSQQTAENKDDDNEIINQTLYKNRDHAQKFRVLFLLFKSHIVDDAVQ